MLITTIILCVIYVCLLIYFIIGWNRINEFIPNKDKCQIKVSIIIPARNEEKNIKSTLDDLLNQDCPPDLFEIIVVDDNSTDKTYQIIETFIRERKSGRPVIQLIRPRKVQNAEFVAYKKQAIESGIKLSNNDWIITTDADCRRGNKWLSTIINYIERNNPVFISGPVNFHNEKTFFEKSQTLEFLSLIGIGAASLGNNTPTMCNGANLGFKKTVFYELGGYSRIDQIASGDDEFLLHKIAIKYPDEIAFIKNKEAIVYTEPFSKLIDFIQQRKRWVSKSRKYKNPIETIFQVAVYLFHLLILANAVLSIIDSTFFYLFVISLAVKMVSEFSFIVPITNYFRKTKYLFYYLPSAILYIFYVIFIGIYGNIGGYRWKGRRVR